MSEEYECPGGIGPLLTHEQVLRDTITSRKLLTPGGQPMIAGVENFDPGGKVWRNKKCALKIIQQLFRGGIWYMSKRCERCRRMAFGRVGEPL